MLHTITGELQPAAPFDFTPALRFVQGFQPTEGEQHIQTGAQASITKAVYANHQLIVFRVRSTGLPDVPRLSYQLWSPEPLTEATVQAAEDRISFYLSLNDDLRPFYALAGNDPCFAPVAQALYGFHQVKFLTPFEHICWAILTQRTPLPLSQRMKAALIDRFGATVIVEGMDYPAFPEAATLAAAVTDELTRVIRNEQKARYIAGAAQHFANLDEHFLRHGDYEAVRADLLSIKGIGEWSANFVLVRGLGRMEHISAEKRLVSAVSNTYNRPLNEKGVAEIAAGYGPWQGYWALYQRAITEVCPAG